MVAKLAIYVCPVPGCVTIAGRSGSVCPTHPNRALVREVYEHRPKLDSPRPGDLGSTTRSPFNFDSMGDILDNLFGSDRPGGKS